MRILWILTILQVLHALTVESQESMVQLEVVGDGGSNGVVMSLAVTDDVLDITRRACKHRNMNARECSDLLEMVVSLMKDYVDREGVKNKEMEELVYGHSTNSILLRNYHNDSLSSRVRDTHDETLHKERSDEEVLNRPLNIYFHLDTTNNLGDKWTAYLICHYARKNGFKRKIKFATDRGATFVTAVGSILQWIFKEPHERVSVYDSKEQFLEHHNSGLRTSIGNGFIADTVESRLYDDPLIDIVGVRGPLTRAILSRILNRVPPVISDPGLLAPRLYPLYPPPQQARREVGFVVHETHREVFRDTFPQFQDCLIDNHVTLNAQSFFEQLLSYKHIVSSSLHGIVFSHAYGIPVLPVVFHRDLDLDLDEKERTETVVGGDFKYKDYYWSIGYTSFVKRYPIFLSMFSAAGATDAEIVTRLANMAANYWQPDAQAISRVQDTQEALIEDYLDLYSEDRDLAMTPSRNCLALQRGEAPDSQDETPAPFLSLLQQYHLVHALAELYPDLPCPMQCIEQMEIPHPFTQELHRYAKNSVNGRVFGLVFPKKRVKRVRGLADTLGKSLDFSFLGHLTPERAWVYAFDEYSQQTTAQKRASPVEDHLRTSLVRESAKGRNPRKFLFDYEYFNVLASSRFTLCPIGDFQWSYRFLEAIMAMSIPVLASSEPLDIHAETEGYYYYSYTPAPQNGTAAANREHHKAQVRDYVYSREKAEANYQRLLQAHVIGKELGRDIRESITCGNTGNKGTRMASAL